MGNDNYNKLWGILLENADTCELLQQSFKGYTYLVTCRISGDFVLVRQIQIKNAFNEGVSKSYQAAFMLRI